MNIIEQLRDVSERLTKMNAGIQEILRQAEGQEIISRPETLLTDREREIYQLIAAGQEVKNIAERLKLSIKTIESHRDNIRKKFGFATSDELTMDARKRRQMG